MEEGTILRWHKQPGQYVQKGEAVVEVETEKTSMEVEAPESGTLAEILAREGEVVKVTGIIGIIQTA
jgi:pyruvate/2-oxoglutarate dehydrogenase complex dihydrolipoamide acyltransferase (E2) component